MTTRNGKPARKVSANGLTPPANARSYRGELPEQAKLEEGDTVSGFFVSMKVITIKDQNTKQDKDVRVYTFRDTDDNKFAILGRTMLDTAFDNCVEHEGGWEAIVGMAVQISRAKDTKMSGGRTLGNYDVIAWEASRA